MAEKKIKKTSLQEAKANYEEIQAFAEEAIKKEMNSKIQNKVTELMEESLNKKEVVEENVTVTTDSATVEISDDGTVSVSSDGGEIETDDIPSEMSDEDPIEVSDDEDPIEVSDDEDLEDNELEEIIHNENTMGELNIDEEAVAPTPAATTAAPAPAAAMPAEEMPAEEMPAETPEEEPVDIIDDESSESLDDPMAQIAQGIEAMIDQKLAGEAGVPEEASTEMPAEMPAEAPAEAPAEMPAEAPEESPIAEMNDYEDDEILEIVNEDFMGEENVFEIVDEDSIYEVMIPEDDESRAKDTAMYDMGIDDASIFDEPEDTMEEPYKHPGVDGSYDDYEGKPIDETGRGLGNAVKRTGNRTKKMQTMPGSRTPVTSLNENKIKKQITEAANKAAKEIKAQYESKMDELKQENVSLTKTIKSLNENVKNYEKSFIDIRNQFNLMETFNAKLAFANQLYANGGFSKKERLTIAESFDQVNSYDEAEKLFKSIVKENKISTKKDITSKIKQVPTNTIKATKTTEPLYESVEMKRMIELAGIDKKII